MKLIPEPDCPELHRHPKSGVWYYRKYVTGRGEFYCSTRERKSKSKAKAIGLRMFAEWMGTAEDFKKAQFLFQHMAEKYIETKRNRRDKTKVSTALHTRKHLRPYFDGFPMALVADKWEEYVAHKRVESPDRKFFNDTKHMRGILKLAYHLGALKKPAEIKNPDAKTAVGKEYSEDEIARLLAKAGPDLKLQINMAYLMGMRRSEILKLRWDRIDLEHGEIKLRAEDTKTGQPREVPIHKDVWIELERRLDHLKTLSPFLFPSPVNEEKPIADNKTAWRRCKRAAGVNGRFHDLRHTAVTRMIYHFNVAPAHVAAIVGMSVSMIGRYAHPRGRYLKSAMDAIRGISGSLKNDGEKTNDQDDLRQ